jgi:hypothetical protein
MQSVLVMMIVILVVVKAETSLLLTRVVPVAVGVLIE